ncbi:MAG: DUF123 domain-containing protein [Candidatus Lokiarchaeota archaeon]|nr:DUF123 domain-containing protein [Candidatus Lokiarchaeota archaeon]
MKGVYILIIKKSESSYIKVGSFGDFEFPKGYYLYVGSALGRSTSIENRLGRHFRNNKKIHWHIDYLINEKNTEITKAFYAKTTKKLECDLFQALNKSSNYFNILIKDFGSSDCKEHCGSHLLYANNVQNLDLQSYLQKGFLSINLKMQQYSE